MIEILPGPLVIAGRAIEARLKQVVGPEKFTYQWLPAKLDRKVWGLLIQRTPSISLQYVGFKKGENNASLIGIGFWNVWLAIRNASSAEAGLFGDSLAPHGALAVEQVAMVALHGMTVKGIGTVTVVQAEPAAFLESDDPGIFCTCLTVQIDRMSIAGTDVLTGGIASPGSLTTEFIGWSFGDSGEIDQTDTITNTGTS